MARLTISLLGPPRIEVDGEPIAVDTRKAIALLAYLAVTGERKSRETLAALLWPEHDSEHARAALRRTLSALSKALGGDFLDVERAAVALDPSDAWLDVTEFRGHLTGSRDADAVALYRGDFLAGFGLRDSVEFEDWQFFEAETLKRELAGALERLAGERGAEGQFDGAIELARRWLALDPLQEPAHRLLMELYARSDQRSAALRQYRDCVRVLDGELGVAHSRRRPLCTRRSRRTRFPSRRRFASRSPSGSSGGGRLSPGRPIGRTPIARGRACRLVCQRTSRPGGGRGRHRKDAARRRAR